MLLSVSNNHDKDVNIRRTAIQLMRLPVLLSMKQHYVLNEKFSTFSRPVTTFTISHQFAGCKIQLSCRTSRAATYTFLATVSTAPWSFMTSLIFAVCPRLYGQDADDGAVQNMLFETEFISVGFEVSTATIVHTAALWDLGPHSLVHKGTTFQTGLLTHHHYSQPWSWRQYAPLKHRSPSTIPQVQCLGRQSS